MTEYHHLPPKNAPLDAKYLLNRVKYQKKRMKAGMMTDEKKAMLECLLSSRSTAHTGRRKKNV